MVDCSYLFEPDCLLNLSESHIVIENQEMAVQIFRTDSNAEPVVLEKGKEMEGQFKKRCYGVFGFFDLLETSYLAVVDRCSLVGHLLKSKILRIDSLFFTPLNPNITKLAASKNGEYLRMIQEIVETGSLYFSKELNLTLNLQRIFERAISCENINGKDLLFKAFDSRFQFNFPHCSYFFEHNLEKIIFPVIHGFVSIHHFGIGPHSLDFVIISRKDVRRLGRRYIVRGLDQDGNAVNFAETEQAIITNEPTKRISSYVQTRGSIPLLWTQKPNLKWEPPMIVDPDDGANKNAAQKHLQEMISLYGKVKLR